MSEPGATGGSPRVIAGKLIVRARGSRYTRNVAVLAGGTAAGQAIGVLASPILTRLYTPADFGVFASVTAILSIVVIVSALRYDVAVPLVAEDENAANLLVLSLLIVLATSILLTGGVLIFADQILGIAGIESLREHPWIVPVGVMGAGAYQVLLSWAIRAEAIDAIARTKVSQGLGMAGAQLGLGVLGVGPVGLLVGWAAGQTSGTGTLGTLAWDRDGEALRRVSRRGIRWVAVRYRRLAALSTLSAFLNTLVLSVPVLFLTTAYDLHVAGSYMLGQRVVAVPMLLLGRSMAQVYIAEVFRLTRENPLELHGLFARTARRLILVGVVPVLGLTLTAPWTFGIVFGQQWHDAGLYMVLLAPMLLVQFVANPLSGTLEAMERQGLDAVVSVVRLLLLALGLLLVPLLALDDFAAVGLLGVLSLLGYVFYTVVTWVALKKQRARLIEESPVPIAKSNP